MTMSRFIVLKYFYTSLFQHKQYLQLYKSIRFVPLNSYDDLLKFILDGFICHEEFSCLKLPLYVMKK